jgi:hypothetical protein
LQMWTVDSRRHGSLAWWCTPESQLLRRLRQENCEFKASLGYIWESFRPCCCSMLLLSPLSLPHSHSLLWIIDVSPN